MVIESIHPPTKLTFHLAAILLWLPIAPFTQADTIVLNNGDCISGNVIGISGNRVRVQTGYAGDVIVKQEAIKTIESDRKFEIFDRSNNVSVGTFEASMDISAIKLARLPWSLEDWRNMVGWDHRLSGSLARATGNSDVFNYAARAETTFVQKRSEHVLRMLVQRDVADGQTRQNQFTANYQLHWFLTPKWFSTLNTDFYRDPLKDVDKRAAFAGGLGHRFWEHSLGKMTFEAGISYVIETFVDLSNRHPALRFATEYRKKLFGSRVEIFHLGRTLTIPAAGRGLVFDGTDGLRLRLASRFDLNAQVDIHHDTHPPSDRTKTDYTFSFGIGAGF